jgi:SHS2 domain-containing protein
MNKETAGFREHEHTADWELEVWAPDLPGLLEQAVRGMYSLSGIHLAEKPRQERSIQVEAFDAEGLLVQFLQEVLYLGEVDGLGFDAFEIHIEDHTLDATLSGSPIEAIKKEVKAVTYHKLQVKETDSGVSARIVLDV